MPGLTRALSIAAPRSAMACLVLAYGLAGIARADHLRQDFAPVDAFLAELVASHDLPGCSLRVIQDGDVVYERAVGWPLDQEVPTASAAKWLTAAVVMAVVDQGYLELDDTTGQWLGWTGEKGAITLRQLMAHTSGIEPAAAPCLGDQETTLAACVAEIYTLPLIGPAGEQFRYGGNSMQVAGRMCEVATGERPFVALLADYVGGPLDLASTAYTSSTNPRLAGGATTSLRDYSRLVEMWLGGGEAYGVRVMSPAAAATALADQTAGAPAQALPPCVPVYHGYGIGNWIWEVDEFGQPRENASPGAFRLTPWLDRSRNLTGTFLTVTTADICAEIEQLKQLIRDIVDGVVTAVPDEAVATTSFSLGPIRGDASGGSVVDFEVPAAGSVRVLVLDLAGRRVATLAGGHVTAGRHTVFWHGKTDGGLAAPAGVYLIALEAGGRRLGAPMLRLR